MFARGFKTWCETASVNCRSELGLEPHGRLDPLVLATHLGVAVWSADAVPGLEEDVLRVLVEEDSSSWSAFTVYSESGSVIVTNPAHSGGRPASNLMHELAHIMIGHEPARVEVAEDGSLMVHSFDRTQENEANWLGGCLLLPRPALLSSVERGLTPRDIATEYGVSEKMASYRMAVTGVERHARRRSRFRRNG